MSAQPALLTTPTAIQFRVIGTPKPGGSKRAFKHKYTGKIIVKEDCERNKEWRAAVQTAAIDAFGMGHPLSGPLAVSVAFYLKRPKNHHIAGSRARPLKADAPAKPDVLPDSTKLWRSTEDALTGILWHDDGQVTTQVVQKYYADAAHPVGAIIAVWEDL